MAGFSLRKNMVFDWNGTEYRIDRIQPNGELLLERMSDGHLSIVSRELLLAEYREGKISAKTAESSSNKSLVPTFSRPLNELSEGIRKAVNRRKHYLDIILDHGVPVFTPALRDRSRVVPRSDRACVFTKRFLRSENAGFPKSRRVIARMMLDTP